MKKWIGKQTVKFENPVYVLAASSIAGKKEGQGRLAKYFDIIEEDDMMGAKTWEEAESILQNKAADLAIKKARLKNDDIRYIISGDLLGQLIATSFGVEKLQIPMFGIYGACSTMGEALSLGAMIIDGGFADKVVSLTSSHFCGAEKQFRFPLAYGNQRPLSSTWTITGSGAVVLSDKKGSENIVIRGITTGKVIDFGIKDSMNMGACMAPAAADVIYQNLDDLGVEADYYDKIITGDLGYVGKDILCDIMDEKGKNINKNHMDCGIEIYYNDEQDTHSGGSGCGCSAITLTGYIFNQLRLKKWNRVLFVPTGALLSQVSFNEGNSVPAIAHGVIFETI